MKNKILEIILEEGWTEGDIIAADRIEKLMSEFCQWLYIRCHGFVFRGQGWWDMSDPDKLTYCDLNRVFNYWFNNIKNDSNTGTPKPTGTTEG